MRVFHRLKQTLSVSIESLLDQVENQEAVVIATIREVEQGGSRVRVHRKGCERRIDVLERTSTLFAEPTGETYGSHVQVPFGAILHLPAPFDTGLDTSLFG